MLRGIRRTIGAGMKVLPFFLALLFSCAGLRAQTPEWLPIEKEVEKAVATDKVTIVHFWATWCPNCRAELSEGGWAKFMAANPDANFIFVTARSDIPGGPELAKHGVGPQKNFTHLQHPNPSRRPGEEMTSFMGMRVGWMPATWVFRNGRLRYALNYGEIRFPILQQLVNDATGKWDRPALN